MNDRELEATIIKAVAGDTAAIEDILHQYMPMINNASVINGVFDEDCRQHILVQVIVSIIKFAI